MIVRELAWTGDARDPRVRLPRFVRRAPLSSAKIAAIANTVEQRLGAVFGTAPHVDVFPPIVLEEGQWPRLCEDAHVFAMDGNAALLIGRAAARRIVACAFGESVDAAGPELSPLEARVLERFASELASGLRSVCSGPPSVYCELRMREPFEAIIGVGVQAEPASIPFAQLAPRALDECLIECTVRLGVATADIFTIADLSVGNVVRLETKVGPSATLNLGADPIAAGEGGVLGDRSAFRVHELI